MDKEKYIQRNKESALARFGDRLDDNRNVVGTDFYFDYFWRLRKMCEETDHMLSKTKREENKSCQK